MSADLRGAKVARADLQRANLYGANLQRTNLQQARLREACLQGADLTSAHLVLANLTSANLRGANLQGARELTQEQIEWSIGINETELPEGINRPRLWSKDFQAQRKILEERLRVQECKDLEAQRKNPRRTITRTGIAAPAR